MKKFKWTLLIVCFAILICMLAGCSHEHQYVEQTIKAATCTETGLMEEVCSICGAKKPQAEVPALGHDYALDASGGKVYMSDPSNHWFECTRCGFKDQTAAHDIDGDFACSACKFALYDFQETADGYILTKYNGALDAVEIPAAYKSKAVVGIGKEAFEGSSVQSIVLPASVKAIGRDAFVNCNALTSVTSPSLAAWCAVKFENYAANPVYYSHSLTIGQNKIDGALDLAGVEEVGEYAFCGLQSLKTVTIPATLKKIGYRAFENAFSSGEEGGDPVVNITDLAAWCAIEFSSGKADVGACTANPLSSGAALMLQGSPVASITPSMGISKISAYAFFGYDGLQSVTIGSEEVGEYAFAYCGGLTSVVAQGAESISKGAFEGCDMLATLTLDSVVEIGERAFYGCAKLQSLQLPQTATTIGAQAFYNCAALATVEVSDNLLYIGAGAFKGAAIVENSARGFVYIGKVLYTFHDIVEEESEDDEPVAQPDLFVIKNDTLAIADNALSNVIGLTELVIPDSVVYIGKNAVRYTDDGDSYLRYIVVGSGVKTIGENAFDGNEAIIYFNGDAQAWEAVEKSGNAFDEDMLYFFSASYPFTEEVTEGNYWRYDEDGLPAAWQFDPEA